MVKFDEMTDLAKSLRGQLAEEFSIWTTRVAVHRKADDGTEKLLLEFADGNRIECVLLRDDKDHRTICLSTQVGCDDGMRVLREWTGWRGSQSHER